MNDYFFVQDYSSHVEALQPSLASSGLQQHYHACVEFARAVWAAVQAVLRAARLPALLLGGEQYGGSGGGRGIEQYGG